MTAEIFMVVIDDLEKIEAETIADFLKEAVENGDLELAIQDCISVAKEIKFHQFQPNEGQIEGLCKKCKKRSSDTIHSLAVEETD
ncbi:MAG TPA: hypothetical protein VLE02_02685 [Nitrosarchaeum sp.]|nr:hypothetical protein [Nitrosarchaeum sp.]